MLTRLARWWLARKVPAIEIVVDRTDECEVCAAELRGDQRHAIYAVHDDDQALGIEGGGTGGCADYCAEHCPGGCTQGCATTTR